MSATWAPKEGDHHSSNLRCHFNNLSLPASLLLHSTRQESVHRWLLPAQSLARPLTKLPRLQLRRVQSVAEFAASAESATPQDTAERLSWMQDLDPEHA